MSAPVNEMLRQQGIAPLPCGEAHGQDSQRGIPATMQQSRSGGSGNVSERHVSEAPETAGGARARDAGAADEGSRDPADAREVDFFFGKLVFF